MARGEFSDPRRERFHIPGISPNISYYDVDPVAYIAEHVENLLDYVLINEQSEAEFRDLLRGEGYAGQEIAREFRGLDPSTAGVGAIPIGGARYHRENRGGNVPPELIPSKYSQYNLTPVFPTQRIRTDDYELPTATSKPERPRTLGAMYSRPKEGDEEGGTLTLVFRDGTWYNYYGVEPDVWQDFRGRTTKWEFIKNTLDNYSRGPADMRYFTEPERELLYRILRSAQMTLGGSLTPMQGQFRGKSGNIKKRPPTASMKKLRKLNLGR